MTETGIRVSLLTLSALLCLLSAEIFLRIFAPNLAWRLHKDPHLGWATQFYQEFRPDERYADLKDCSFVIRGVQVSLWREGDLCMVMAH